MHREEQVLGATLRQAQRFVDGQAPDFEEVFDAAERQVRGRRKVQFVAMAAAISAVALGLLLLGEDEFTYIDTDELMATTQWSAPSDSLLPAHRFDIYRELPRLIELPPVSTDPDEGALL
jgi:hypothetical protein